MPRSIFCLFFTENPKHKPLEGDLLEIGEFSDNYQKTEEFLRNENFDNLVIEMTEVFPTQEEALKKLIRQFLDKNEKGSVVLILTGVERLWLPGISRKFKEEFPQSQIASVCDLEKAIDFLIVDFGLKKTKKEEKKNEQ